MSAFVLITGCSSGIGAALAAEFAARDFQVIATARRPEALKDLSDRYANITALSLDVCDAESINRLQQKVRTLTQGKLAYLINNAGSHYASPSIELEMDKVVDLFNTNVFGVMRLCSAFADMLIAARGTIVQIGSVTRDVPVVWQSSYNASKAAMSQYTNTLRLELEPFGVKVCEVVTGFVQSNILSAGLHSAPGSLYLPIKSHIAGLKHGGNRNGMPASVYARTVADHVVRSKPPSEMWSGAQAHRLWFIVTWLPSWLRHYIWHKIFKLELLA